jgi:hypothetical protein
MDAQSRQIARHFLQSYELGPPHPLTSRRMCPPFGSAGDTLACGRGDGGSQFGRGDRHCGTLGICTLCMDVSFTLLDYIGNPKYSTKKSIAEDSYTKLHPILCKWHTKDSDTL